MVLPFFNDLNVVKVEPVTVESGILVSNCNHKIHILYIRCELTDSMAMLRSAGRVYLKNLRGVPEYFNR